mgnify:CR=1 FL=1
MARVTLRITGTQLLCQDEHPSLLAALESHNVAVEYQCRSEEHTSELQSH